MFADSNLTSARPEVAIVGAGLMGRWHASVARREGARIVGVVDADRARARRLAAACGAPDFATVEAMLGSVRPTVSHVCTPLASHVDYCRLLLSGGSHVLCEKPLATAADEVESLLEAARRAARVVCPVHQFVMQDGVRLVIARLAELGPLTRVEFTFSSAGGGGRQGPALDDVVADIVPHAFSVLCRLLRLQQEAELRWQAVRPAAGELCALTAVDGVVVSLAVSMSSRPTEAAAVVVGQRGSAFIDFFHGFGYLVDGKVSRTRKVLHPFMLASRHGWAAVSNLTKRAWRGEAAYPGLRSLVAGFYRASASGVQGPLSSDEIVETYRARDALLRRAGEAA